MSVSAGRMFRQAVTGQKRPLQIFGAVNAYTALLAQHAGANALYLSGSGVATATHGLPDLGMTSLQDVVHDAACITRAVPKAPLLADIDTGFGSGTTLNVSRTIQEMSRVGVAAVHMEDQQSEMKRCGHRPGTQLVSPSQMIKRIEAAVSTRDEISSDMVIMARTDAMAAEGVDAAVDRAAAYVEAGADMLFIEACTELEQYRAVHEALPGVPLLANVTEFGCTPLWNSDELGDAGVSMVLYALSAHRAMAKAALGVYSSIIENGHQREVVPMMQTREELYEVLDYQRYERQLDSDEDLE